MEDVIEKLEGIKKEIDSIIQKLSTAGTKDNGDYEIDCTGLNTPLPMLRLKKAHGKKDFKPDQKIKLILSTDFAENVKDIKYLLRVAEWPYSFTELEDGVLLTPVGNTGAKQ